MVVQKDASRNAVQVAIVSSNQDAKRRWVSITGESEKFVIALGSPTSNSYCLAVPLYCSAPKIHDSPPCSMDQQVARNGRTIVTQHYILRHPFPL